MRCLKHKLLQSNLHFVHVVLWNDYISKGGVNEKAPHTVIDLSVQHQILRFLFNSLVVEEDDLLFCCLNLPLKCTMQSCYLNAL